MLRFLKENIMGYWEVVRVSILQAYQKLVRICRTRINRINIAVFRDVLIDDQYIIYFVFLVELQNLEWIDLPYNKVLINTSKLDEVEPLVLIDGGNLNFLISVNIP